MYWELLVALAGIVFTAGGLVTWVKVTLKHFEEAMERMNKRLDVLETRVNNHEEHFSRHDVVFENITVNQEYMIKGIDRIEKRLDELEKEKS